MDSKSLVALRTYLRERSRILLLSKILLDKAQIVESGGDISQLMQEQVIRECWDMLKSEELLPSSFML